VGVVDFERATTSDLVPAPASHPRSAPVLRCGCTWPAWCRACSTTRSPQPTLVWPGAPVLARAIALELLVLGLPRCTCSYSLRSRSNHWLKWSTWFDTFLSRASAIAVASLEIEKRLQSRLDGLPTLPLRLRLRSDILQRRGTVQRWTA
jgi:hypothetical protein